MKRYLLILVFISSFSHLFCQKPTLKEFADKEGITAIIISKNMLSLFPKDGSFTYGGVNIGEFIDKLSRVNMFVSPAGNDANKLIKYATEFMETPGYEKMMSIKTKKGEDANVFIRGNEKNISEFILIFQGDSKKSAVLQLIGNFTMQDIQQIIAETSK